VLAYLRKRGLSVILDRGVSSSECARADTLSRRIPGIRTFSGPYAPFASMISQAKLYLGYDSAGQHVAAACAVPLVSVFAGYASDRMFQRWTPWGCGPRQIVNVSDKQPNQVLQRTKAAVEQLIGQIPA